MSVVCIPKSRREKKIGSLSAVKIFGMTKIIFNSIFPVIFYIALETFSQFIFYSFILDTKKKTGNPRRKEMVFVRHLLETLVLSSSTIAQSMSPQNFHKELRRKVLQVTYISNLIDVHEGGISWNLLQC